MVLPDDRVVDWMTGFTIPDNGGLTLVGNADSGNRRAIQARTRDGLGGDPCLGRPDFLRVVLDPTRLRINLSKFLLRHRHYIALAVEHHRARTCGALVERQDV